MILVLAMSPDDERRLAMTREKQDASRASFRLASRFWRDLEIVLRWIFLNAQERKAHPRSLGVRAQNRSDAEPVKTAGLASASRAATLPSKSRPNVLVVGRVKFTEGLLRCLLSEDVNVHAIAVDRDEARDLTIMGAMPHALQDIADQAAPFDLVLSTDLMQYIGADVLARLPEHAVILDLAPPPGSVDYESAKALGRRAIWARAAISEGRAVFCPATWGQIRHVLDFCRRRAVGAP